MFVLCHKPTLDPVTRPWHEQRLERSSPTLIPSFARCLANAQLRCSGRSSPCPHRSGLRFAAIECASGLLAKCSTMAQMVAI
jgi:hypothetical protein